jgi:hypothetical protein
MIDLIREEIKKDNPDWLLISSLSQKIYLESNKANLLGIRVNMINHVKVGKYNGGDIFGILGNVFPETKIIIVGGYGITVTEAVKIIKKLEPNETIIIINDRDALIKHLGTHQSFKCNIQNQYNNNKIMVKWTNVETGEITKFEPSELKAMIREQKINEILN